MTRIVEKPSTPISKLANIGLYYVRDWRALFDGISHVRRQPPGKGGEFYLTDAFQHMVDNGRKLFTAPVGGWYDCGKVDTLLETNRHLLESGHARAPGGGAANGRALRPPVYVEEGVEIVDSVIGPNVSIETGGFVSESTVVNSILGKNVRVVRATVVDSLVGDSEIIEGDVVRGQVLDAGQRATAG
jgi:glucose-1-phosphate thymidylyltransferase